MEFPKEIQDRADLLTGVDRASAKMKQARRERDKRRAEAAMTGGAAAGLAVYGENVGAAREALKPPPAGLAALDDAQLEAAARAEALAGRTATEHVDEMERRRRQYTKE